MCRNTKKKTKIFKSSSNICHIEDKFYLFVDFFKEIYISTQTDWGPFSLIKIKTYIQCYVKVKVKRKCCC